MEETLATGKFGESSTLRLKILQQNSSLIFDHIIENMKLLML